MTPSEIIAHVALQAGITTHRLLSRCRWPNVVGARVRAMYLMRLSGMHPEDIGKATRRDRTSVICALRKCPPIPRVEAGAMAHRPLVVMGCGL